MEELSTLINANDNAVMADNIQNLMNMLSLLAEVVKNGTLDDVKTIFKNLHNVAHVGGENLLFKLYGTKKICINQIDLIISACKHNKPEMLQFLLHEANLLTNPYLTDDEVDERRSDAFGYAIGLNDIHIIEMLYDFWCTRPHWSGYCNMNRYDITDNIRRVGQSLKIAGVRKENCKENHKEFLIEKGQLFLDIHCMNTFNAFQIELYTKLKELQVPEDQSEPMDVITQRVKAMRSIIYTILSVYEKYSKINMVRVEDDDADKDEAIKTSLSLPHFFYMKGLLSLSYEVYFRKLDFNISLLLLDNLDFLKKHLSVNPLTLYDNIECKIYYFIYRTNEYWRLYLPKNKIIVRNQIPGLRDGQLTLIETNYDANKINNGAVIYLERLQFKNCIIKYIRQLNKIPLNENIVEDPHDTSHNSVNCLTELPYMRNYYSLKKIIDIIEAVLDNNNDAFDETTVLNIEMAIVMIAEMTKYSSESLHISKSINALIANQISISDLKKIRDYVTHLDCKGHITTYRRIEIASSKKHIYQKVYEDLKNILDRLIKVQYINKFLLDKSLLESGLEIIQKKIEALTSESLENIVGMPEQESWLKTADEQLNKEYKINMAQQKHVVEILFEYINNPLNDIKHWNRLKKKLENKNKKKLSKDIDYPKKDTLYNLANKIQKYGGTTSDIQNIKQMPDIAAAKENILNILEFAEKEICSNQDDLAQKFRISRSEKYTVNEFITKIENISGFSTNINPTATRPSFPGIKALVEVLYVKGNATDNKDKGSKILSSLTNRIDILKKTLESGLNSKNVILSDHQDVLILRYNQDRTFRITIQMLLMDIFNIFEVCDIRPELCIKSTKLLAGNNLRNLLVHGNPLIEVIGDILDDQDLSTELVSKAIKIIENSVSILNELKNCSQLHKKSAKC